MKKTEVLAEAFRRAIGGSCMHLLCHPPHTVLAGLKVKETKAVYGGEVTELTPTEAENPLSGYGKTVSHVIVGLKTVRGTKQLCLDPSIYEAILKEKIGDVVYIEHKTGAVKVSGHTPFLRMGSACGVFRRVCFYLRPRSGDICPTPKRRRAQAKRIFANRHSRRP